MPVGSIVGIIVAAIVIILLATTVTFICRKKLSDNSGANIEEESAKITLSDNEADDTLKASATTSSGPATQLSGLVARLRAHFDGSNDDSRRMDESAASEFEKIDLTDIDVEKAEITEEKKDVEKLVENETTAETDVDDNNRPSVGRRVRAFLTKFVQRPEKTSNAAETSVLEDTKDKQDLEDIKEEDTGKKSEEEEGVKDEKAPKRTLRGSETPV